MYIFIKLAKNTNMKKLLSENTKTAIILALFLLMLITGYYAYNLRQKYINTRLNTYNQALVNVVNYVNNVENYLAKATISKSPEYSSEALTQIWRDANLAQVYLSQIPLEQEALSKTSRFLNQVGDYSYSLSQKTMANEELSSEDLENLQTLHQYSMDLESSLNQISDEVSAGVISWNSLENTNQFAQAVSSVNVFENIDGNLNEYEGLIYDGAYSDHVEKVEKKGLTGEDCTEDEAMEKVREFFGIENVKDISSNGFIENAKIPCYDFAVTLYGDKRASIEISKKGAHVIESSINREVETENISLEDAAEKGKTFLDEHDFKYMRETYYLKEQNILTVNFAYDEDGTVVYPDLIKVKIALDNGEILGIETYGYLNSHTTRKLPFPEITIDEAREKINPNLEIISEGTAIIPTEWKTEVYCYEFKGRVDDKEFLVYINTETGKEEDILVILNTPGGILTT